MLVKIALLFLLAMILIAMIGRALFPGVLRRPVGRFRASTKPATCPRCGNFVIGTGPCTCGLPQRKA